MGACIADKLFGIRLAPSNGAKQTVQQCATDIANHWSLAGLLPGHQAQVIRSAEVL